MYKIFLFYDFSYKSLFGLRSLRIRFDKVDDFIRVYLPLFDSEKYNPTYNGIGYLLSQKMILHIMFFIIMQKAKLILMILYI